MRGSYYLGFDIGTNSVGFAVTDEQYKVLKFRGHKMWGARLFDEAETAANRRMKRSERRRRGRQKARLGILEELFAEEIAKVDSSFYQRLEESKFFLEDKKVKEKHLLFVGEGYNDKDYHKEFKTIYHLRNYLMESEKKEDIRLIFLACHHILKHRGHFLFEGENFNLSNNLENLILELLSQPELISENAEVEILVPTIVKLLISEKSSLNDKRKGLKDFLKQYKLSAETALQEAFILCIGGKANLDKVFDEEGLTKLSFSEKPFEEVRDVFEAELGEKIYLVELCKKIYDVIILSKILKDSKNVSEGKIKSYEKHQADLKDLKKLLNENRNDFPEDFRKVLKEDSKSTSNYLRYVGRSENDKRCSEDDFYVFLKGVIKKYPDSELKNQILEECENKTFLPLQKSKENSAIPYQLHKMELQAILEKAAKHYSFLNEEEDGISVREKIISLLEFRIPYYVGPLNSHHGKFSWIGKVKERIRPWNFEKVVDEAACVKSFIGRMTNKCTYLFTEDVLPKDSLLYSEFVLLNEVNNLTCDGKKLPIEIKTEFIKYWFKDISKPHSKVTEKRIKEWLINRGLATKESKIAGIDKEIKSDLRAYREFKKILGDKFSYSMVEDLIKWHTLFGESKKILKKEIKNEYGNILSSEEIRAILKLRFKDWGRLSKEFLTEIRSERMFDGAGEEMNIITALRTTDLNLNMLLASGNGFDEKIEEFNQGFSDEIKDITYDLVDKVAVSPAVKRGVWQALLVLKEIVKIMGQPPKKIFLEVTRENETEAKKQKNKSKRNARKEQLEQLFKACKNCSFDWKKELSIESEDRLRSKKLFLYYLQHGRSAYSDEVIDLDDLMAGNSKYDIDHIFPRSLTKDDSLDNLVLCLKSENQEKEDVYPISAEIQNRKLAEWRYLTKNGFMSDKKFERLTRKTVLTEVELAGFIARQLVETGQTNKVIATLLKRIYPEADIVYAKAKNVSEYRYGMNEDDMKKTGLFHKYIKVRSVNDFHHAKDAYLNIVVGNVFDCKFTKNPANFVKNSPKRSWSLTTIYKHEVRQGNYVAWLPGIDGTQAIVDKEMKSNDVRVTRKVAEQRAELHDANPIKASAVKGDNYLPFKADERYLKFERYGAYPKIKNSYYSIYRYTIINRKGSWETTTKIGFVPLYLKKELETDEAKRKFFEGQVSLKKGEILKEVEIIYSKLRINTKIKVNGMFYRLGGRSNDKLMIDNAIPLVLDDWSLSYIKLIEKELDPDKPKVFNRLEKITKKLNEDLFNQLANKLFSGIYSKRKSFDYDTFFSETTKEKFANLSIMEQGKTLLNILNVITNQKSVLDLKALGMTTSRATIGVNLNNLDEFIIIEESVTGLFEKEVVIIGEKK